MLHLLPCIKIWMNVFFKKHALHVLRVHGLWNYLQCACENSLTALGEKKRTEDCSQWTTPLVLGFKTCYRLWFSGMVSESIVCQDSDACWRHDNLELMEEKKMFLHNFPCLRGAAKAEECCQRIKETFSSCWKKIWKADFHRNQTEVFLCNVCRMRLKASLNTSFSQQGHKESGKQSAGLQNNSWKIATISRISFFFFNNTIGCLGWPKGIMYRCTASEYYVLFTDLCSFLFRCRWRRCHAIVNVCSPLLFRNVTHNINSFFGGGGLYVHAQH